MPYFITPTFPLVDTPNSIKLFAETALQASFYPSTYVRSFSFIKHFSRRSSFNFGYFVQTLAELVLKQKRFNTDTLHWQLKINLSVIVLKLKFIWQR